MVNMVGSSFEASYHNGPNQAGNKSLLTYRPDIGVPGYTGFIPGHVALLLPTKGSTFHTGKPADSRTKTAAAAATTLDPARASEYLSRYQLSTSATRPTDKTGGGYWFAARERTADAPFLATSTYQAEVLRGAETMTKQLDATDTLLSTVVGYEAARTALNLRRTQSAEPSDRGGVAGRSVSVPRTIRPPPPVTGLGEMVGYQTTAAGFGDHSKFLQESAKTISRYSENTLSAVDAHAPRLHTMPRVMAPGMQGVGSTYRQDFGEESSDPMSRTAAHKTLMSRTATTNDLAHGTTRNVSHVPGYTGHLPASAYNPLGRMQAEGAQPRPDHKADATLYKLDQFSRTRVPNYTGFKPQASQNITTDQPSQGPSLETTYGLGNAAVAAFGVPKQSHEHYINSRTGLMNLFTSSGPYVSDNGLSNAQTYFKIVRGASDGAFATERPSKTTVSGAPFNARTSLV